MSALIANWFFIVVLLLCCGMHLFATVIVATVMVRQTMKSTCLWQRQMWESPSGREPM